MRRPTTLQPMSSSLFSGYSYDPATNRLTVQFVGSGETYVYEDVPMEKATAFAESASPGRFYTVNIRDNFVSSKVS